MYFKNRQMTDSLAINRLILKRDQTFSEVRELNEEIETIRTIIKSKHQSIQKMSVRIIKRQQTMQHIRLASSQPKWKVLAEEGVKKRDQSRIEIALVRDEKYLVGRQ